jgi:hypothetical protein
MAPWGGEGSESAKMCQQYLNGHLTPGSYSIKLLGAYLGTYLGA